MFTGIVESIGKVKKIEEQEENLIFTITSDISKDLKIDQSVSHDGCCLTVTSQNNEEHVVCAIKETLLKTQLDQKKVGDLLIG